MIKNLHANTGDRVEKGSIPGSGRCPGGGHGNPLQYSCQENPMDRGTWWAPVHGVAELDTSEVTEQACYHMSGTVAWTFANQPTYV